MSRASQTGNERENERVIFITGAASGMGAATARLFGERGWRVGAVDLHTERLRDFAEELGPERCFTSALDVGDKAAYDAVISEFAHFSGGRLDLLYNNAGIAESGWFEEVPYEAALRVVQVNFIGVVNGIYAALPLLKNTPNSLCFTTASSSATYGMPRLAIYSATKFAIKGLTEALSIEFRRHGVRVADVLPGIIDTPLLTETTNHSGDVPNVLPDQESAASEGPFRMLSPERVAECVWEAYGSDRLHWYVPEEIEQLDRAKAAGAEGVREQVARSLGLSRESS